MNSEQQRIAIAEWMGWELNKASLNWADFMGYRKGHGGLDILPDYPNDLNAMHEAVFKLPLREKLEFSANLRMVVSRFHAGWSTLSLEEQNYYVENAPPSQRSEALCRTLWPGRFETRKGES